MQAFVSAPTLIRVFLLEIAVSLVSGELEDLVELLLFSTPVALLTGGSCPWQAGAGSEDQACRPQ
jgi:hypothetical protein